LFSPGASLKKSNILLGPANTRPPAGLGERIIGRDPDVLRGFTDKGRRVVPDLPGARNRALRGTRFAINHLTGQQRRH
jgi:hypothetical protein